MSIVKMHIKFPPIRNTVRIGDAITTQTKTMSWRSTNIHQVITENLQVNVSVS